MSQACKKVAGLDTLHCDTGICRLTKQQKPCMHSQALCILCQVSTCTHSLPGGHMHAVMQWACKAYHVAQSIMLHEAVSQVHDHGKLPPDAVSHCIKVLMNCPFVGTLPSEWSSQGAFLALSTLQIVSCSLKGTLPASWGSNNSFPALTTLYLGDNELSGTLPASWGSAWQQLSDLEMFDSNISGMAILTNCGPQC